MKVKVAKDIAPIDVKLGLYRMHNTDGSTMLGMVKKGDYDSPLWVPLHGYQGKLSLVKDIEYIEVIEL